MKKLFSFVMLGAIALAGATMFNSCTSEDAVPVNPTFDGQSVKTAFALNIPHAAKGTRMTDEITQEDGGFRGFQDIYLFPLNAVPADATPFPYVNINLANTGYDADHSTQVGTDARSSQIYQDVNIGVGTNNFLFYAEATTTISSTSPTKAQKFANGILTKTLATTLTQPSEITFDLNPVYDATNATETSAYTAAQTALLAILNGVANVSFTKGGTAKNWKDLDPDPTADGLKYQALADLYAEYTKTARNGSGPNVLKTMQALYNNVSYIWKGSTDADVIACCKAIRDAIKTYFTPDPLEAAADEATAVPAITIPASTSSPDYKGEYYTLAYNISDTNAPDFPKTTFCLPYGAAELTFTTTGTNPGFAYNDNPVGTGFVSGSNLKLTDLCFPASLQYFCNTSAKTNNNTIDDSTWPTTTTAWDSFDWATGWGDVVTSTTRTIALRNNVNYGVAQLAATVKCVASVTTLKDNSSARDGDGGTAADIDVPIPDAGFTVTGFLIGGQPQQVDWQFLPKGTTRSRIIYDNTLNEAMAAKSGTAVGTNYTLVLDNYTTETTQEPVNIAVELTNNSGKDFWGYNGLIAAGQTFYLIGQLNPNATTGRTGTITWPSGTYTDRFPANGTERVFIQDYTTTATFTINDLKKAYSTIPDLRVAKLELGLSVDLAWRAGIEYAVPLGN